MCKLSSGRLTSGFARNAGPASKCKQCAEDLEPTVPGRPESSSQRHLSSRCLQKSQLAAQSVICCQHFILTPHQGLPGSARLSSVEQYDTAPYKQLSNASGKKMQLTEELNNKHRPPQTGQQKPGAVRDTVTFTSGVAKTLDVPKRGRNKDSSCHLFRWQLMAGIYSSFLQALTLLCNLKFGCFGCGWSPTCVM